jgi:hypothetical protein
MNDKIPVIVRLNLVVDISSWRCLDVIKLTRLEYEMGGQTDRDVHFEDRIDK